MWNTLREWGNQQHVRNVLAHSRYRLAASDIRDALFPHWKRTAHLEFPDIPQSADSFSRTMEGLLAFFGRRLVIKPSYSDHIVKS